MSQPFNFCPKCGTENSEGDLYCRNCGYGEEPQENPEPTAPPVGLGDEPLYVNPEFAAALGFTDDDGNPVLVTATEDEEGLTMTPHPEVVFTSEGGEGPDPNMAAELNLDAKQLELTQSSIRTLVSDSIKDRKIRRALKANFPDDNISSIGLTPYGLALMTSVLVQFEVMKRESWFMEHFGCDQESLVERTVQATQDQLFKGIPPNIPTVPCSESVLEDPTECPLSVNQHTPTDMVSHLFQIILRRKLFAPDFWEEHERWHRVAAFTRYGMGCSRFVWNRKSILNVDTAHVIYWFGAPWTFHNRMLKDGFGLIA